MPHRSHLGANRFDGPRARCLNRIALDNLRCGTTPMQQITREQLHAFLDDALSEPEMALVEQQLRQSEPLRQTLRLIMAERDRGEHTLGAIWRRERLTCPTREQLGSFLLQVLDEDEQDYIDFHLHAVNCPYCLANLADLEALQEESSTAARSRQRRYFESSRGFLHIARD